MNVDSSGNAFAIVNNSSGLGAVNIQDGGNSITVDAVSLPLPTGAATEASLVKLVPNQGSATSGQAGPLIQGAVTAAVPSYTNAQISPISLNTSGGLRIDASNTSITANPGPSIRSTYSAAITGLVTAATATDFFTITGSATRVIKVSRIFMQTNSSGGNSFNILLAKRSTVNTGGTSTTPTAVAMDSTNPTATAVVRAYTANPTLGTLVGIIRSEKFFASGISTAATEAKLFDFREGFAQPVVLRGTNEVLSLNLNSTTVTGSAVNCWVEWTEE